MEDVTTRSQKIKELEDLAAEILEYKQERKLRRPLLIEFCGSPKSGKSTTITSLNQFLKRNKFTTTVLTERASICPVSNKKDPFFNIWTLTSAIAEIIEHIDTNDTDIIISDRGIFDALCWFDWLNKNDSIENPYLDNKTYDILKKFVKLDIFKDYLDLVYVFKVDPSISIEREYSNLLTDKRGSIMQEPVLKTFNQSIDNIINETKEEFRQVISIDTGVIENNKNPNIVSYSVTKNILETLRNLLIEKIGYFDLNSLIDNGLKEGINDYKLIENSKISYDQRDIIENNTKYIQPIPIVVITNKVRDSVLVVKKSERLKKDKKDSPEKNKVLLYLGGHIRSEDSKENLLGTIQKSLKREIKEEIGESIIVESLKPFLIYTPSYGQKSKQHLAICYVVEMDFNGRSFKITSDEHIMKTGTSISGHIIKINKIVADEKENLESWGTEILKEVFNISLKGLSLFDE
jgi:predicted NUDIX family phosphoesterase/energy-coupling factor transporter ATP-binding protein EcfA2